MPRHYVTATVTSAWTIHDSWTETYVGVRHIIYDLLPSPGVRMSAETRTLCQLALLGANHLMEIALYKLLKPYTKSSGAIAPLTAALLIEATYHQMLTRWVQAASGKALDLSCDPFLSTERLPRAAKRHHSQIISVCQCPDGTICIDVRR